MAIGALGPVAAASRCCRKTVVTHVPCWVAFRCSAAQGRMGVVGTHFIDNFLMLVGEKCVSVSGMVDTRPMVDCRNSDDPAFKGECIWTVSGSRDACMPSVVSVSLPHSLSRCLSYSRSLSLTHTLCLSLTLSVSFDLAVVLLRSDSGRDEHRRSWRFRNSQDGEWPCSNSLRRQLTQRRCINPAVRS